jgi:glycosyltransferase involved in cell wall biosynthesis
MKVIFNVRYPLAWAKGGVGVLIQQAKVALEGLGIEVEWVDYTCEEAQKADIVHYWGLPSSEIMWHANDMLGMKRVVTYLGPAMAGNPNIKSYVQRTIRSGLIKGLNSSRLFGCMAIGVEDADAFLFQNEAEKRHASFMYGWDPSRCHVVPNGVDEVFLDESIVPEKMNGLFYPAYICPRKNQVAVARAAKKEKVPVVFVGVDQGGYPEYFEEFKREIDDQYVIWLGEVKDQRRFAALYRGTLGTFLASEAENLPLVFPQSLACGHPVMCTKLPSVESFFGNKIQYCPPATDPQFSWHLRGFYDFCLSGGTQQIDLISWADVGRQMLNIYQSITGKTS